MNHSFAWAHRAKAILADVKRLQFDRIARAEIEQLFGVENRSAQRIMRAFGAEPHAGPLFLTKAQTIRGLKQVIRNGTVERTHRRMERVATAITEAAHQWELKSTATGIKQREFQRRQDGLPEGITLAPGSLRIEFQDGAELLKRLALFAAWCGQNREQLAEL